MAWTAQDASRAVQFTVGFCVPAAGTAAENLGISISILELLFQMDVSNIPLQALYEFLQHCQMSPEMGQLQQWHRIMCYGRFVELCIRLQSAKAVPDATAQGHHSGLIGRDIPKDACPKKMAIPRNKISK